MYRTLALKELRETIGIVAIALLVYLAQVSNLVGLKLFTWLPILPERTGEVPFTGSAFLAVFGVVAGILAIALGIRQSVWEQSRNTYLFLLHRPLSRDAIFVMKLVVGIALILVCGTIPIVLYGSWAATPGHHPSPFEWSMTGSAWRLLFLVPLAYLGAFLSGIRPARWFGTRLFPLFCGAVAFGGLSLTPWWSISLPLAVLMYVVLIVAICYQARIRDFS